MDSELSLRFWYCLIIIFNVGSVWSHATEGAVQGHSMLLDFIGPGSVPSRLQLLLLDFAIILLNMLLSTIAYETSLQSHMPANTPDPLLPISPLSPSPSELQSEYPPKPHQSMVQSQYVLDLRLRPIYERLKNPTPTPPERRNEDLLPLPNTTGWQLPGTIRMLVRAGERARLRTEPPAQRADVRDDGRTVPGGLDTEGRG
ncbi:hypothetical protein PHLCEN_2v6480 [Hermanssonia centrifuga]|uniref:DUF1746 domain-containing protein n=1 Tax=Hermanssonia centrifuga TaxID=98765 RepID=A0A2R6NZX6_9APHY|nr:hypothetical protein PHLCEN_2v6480 [Hermanssonia centrifuga]